MLSGQRALRSNERVHFFPFGVDFEEFAKVRDSADLLPQELRDIRRSVVGYVGRDYEQLRLWAARAVGMPA